MIRAFAALALLLASAPSAVAAEELPTAPTGSPPAIEEPVSEPAAEPLPPSDPQPPPLSDPQPPDTDVDAATPAVVVEAPTPDEAGAAEGPAVAPPWLEARPAKTRDQLLSPGRAVPVQRVIERIPVTTGELCGSYGGGDPRRFCRNGVSLANDACALRPDPDVCHDEVRAHPCVSAPRSAACSDYLTDGSSCVKLGSESSECRFLLAMRNFMCARNPALCGGAGPAGDEPLLVTSPLQPIRGIGVTDPGSLGDRGIVTRPTATRPRARGRMPLTGFPLSPLALLGMAAIVLGAVARPSRMPRS